MFYLVGGLKKNRKEWKLGEKSFSKKDTKFPEKGHKQVRDERTQEDYLTIAVYFCRCRVVFLRSFISTLFLSFFQAHP